MSKPTIFVKVPFGYGQHKFKILEAQRWGAIDQILLHAVSERPRSSQELADDSGLPRQLIIEIMIPFMQVGWVELVVFEQHYAFQATSRGKSVSSEEDLPVDKEPHIRTRAFLVDPITQQCYRLERKKKRQSFQVYSRERVQNVLRNRSAYTTDINIKSPYSPELSDIFSCIANDNEEVIGFDESVLKKGYSGIINYAIASVDPEDEISGIPDVSDELREAILVAADKKRELIKLIGDSDSSPSQNSHFFQCKQKEFLAHSVESGQIRLVLGAAEHKNHLYDMVKSAKSKIFIHSTFINKDCLDEILPELLSAARRSVQIDILWGQMKPEEESKLAAYQAIIETISQIQQQINSEGLSTQFTLHQNPTGSHAKFIIADHVEYGYCVTFGSCNWLSSRFNRFEASVNINQLDVVADGLDVAAHLAMGSRGLVNNLSKESAILANMLKRQAKSQSKKLEGNISNTVEVKILSAAEHHVYAKKASSEARHEIFVCSHRMSYAGDRPILTPLKAAILNNPYLNVSVAYGRSSGGMNNRKANDLAQELRTLEFSVLKADDPQVHAKILTWDGKDAVISSLNWLSAAATGDIYSEIGVYIHGDNLTQRIKDAFNSSTIIK